MAWAKCENCNGMGSNFNYSTNQSDRCFSCGGDGKIPVSGGVNTRRNVERTGGGGSGNGGGGVIKNTVNPQQNAKYFLATAAFFGGGYYVLTQITDNLIVVGIVALILAFIAYKWFKAIIVIGVIIAIIYFVGMDK